jgi:hypothetical protein
VTTEQVVRPEPRSIAGCVPGSTKTWISDLVSAGGQLNGIWGPSANDIFVVGSPGILHYDGTSWISQPNPASGQYVLGDVWGSSSANIWVTGAALELLRYDGTSWSVVTVSGLQGFTAGDLGSPCQ